MSNFKSNAMKWPVTTLQSNDRKPAGQAERVPPPREKKRESGGSLSRKIKSPTVRAKKRAPSLQVLRDSEARYRRLFLTAKDGILILDAKTGLIIDVNPFLMTLLDYSKKEFLGKALWDIGLFQDIEASKTAYRELKSKHYVRYDDLPLKTRDGRAINVEFVSNVYGVNKKQVIQCNIRDITKRKYAERSEQQLLQSQKMETLGQLAGGIAHDFNNLLGVILGYCEIMEGRKDLPEPACKMINEIHSAGTSAKELTRHLLAFSRRQVSQPVFLDLNETITRLSTMLGRMIGDDVELVSRLGSGLGTIRADPIQIEQVLMNLAVNARDAMPTGGKITIETSNIEVDGCCGQWRPAGDSGACVMVAMSDTGVGMDKETQSRVFDPFFSTKAIGQGTGLGLSTVFGIVKQSAGSINVYSEPGHGSTFKVYFPRCEAAPSVTKKRKEAPLRGGTETLLLVDDATPLRGLTRQLLTDCGYKVLDSGDAEEALRVARKLKGALPLLITDVVMPGLSGPALAERLAAERPETRVLFTSGYADNMLTKHGATGSDYSFLEKPFTRDELVRKVREILDSPLRQRAG
jgi:two-component system cell cycle sensor histidine kinase/response regulator CckA